MEVNRLALAQSSTLFVLPQFMSLFSVAGYDVVSAYIRNMEPCKETTQSSVELLLINETLLNPYINEKNYNCL